jgi:hypothetical protein
MLEAFAVCGWELDELCIERYACIYAAAVPAAVQHGKPFPAAQGQDSDSATRVAACTIVSKCPEHAVGQHAHTLQVTTGIPQWRTDTHTSPLGPCWQGALQNTMYMTLLCDHCMHSSPYCESRSAVLKYDVH